jgi:hypothetical protein
VVSGVPAIRVVGALTRRGQGTVLSLRRGGLAANLPAMEIPRLAWTASTGGAGPVWVYLGHTWHSTGRPHRDPKTNRATVFSFP